MTKTSSRRFLPLWHPAAFIATWFGSGLAPRAPGTWGSAAALPFAWLLHDAGGAPLLLAAALALFFVGWWAAESFVRHAGIDDPGAIVVDEVVGQWLVLLFAPKTLAFYLLGFVLFRVFDVLKPWPVSWADRRLKGGLGVMTDDVFAGLMGLVIMALLVQP